MAQINPHINFNGNAEEAFLFYKSVFGGEFAMIMRFKDLAGPEFPIAEKDAEKIMHIALPIGKNVLMGNDVPDFLGRVNENENRSKISISAKSKEEAERPFEVKELATGFMMIKREVFETYQQKYPERLFDKDRWMYFQCEVMAGQEKYIGDDFFICRQMRAAGEKIWLCPWMDITHHGMHEFGAPPPKRMRV